MGIRPATWEEEARHWKELFNDLEKRWSIAEQARNELLKEKDRLNDALKGAADIANISGQEIEHLKLIQFNLSSELVNKNKNIDHLLKENARLRDALEFYAYRHNYAFSPIEDNIPKVNLDGGEKARQALEGKP